MLPASTKSGVLEKSKFITISYTWTRTPWKWKWILWNRGITFDNSKTLELHGKSLKRKWLLQLIHELRISVQLDSRFREKVIYGLGKKEKEIRALRLLWNEREGKWNTTREKERVKININKIIFKYKYLFTIYFNNIVVL